MYFGWLTVMVGLGVTLGSIVFIVFVPLAWVVFIYFYLPRYEWPDLKRRFGDEWLAWHRQTPVILPSLWKRWKKEDDSPASGPNPGQKSGLYLNKT
jgi:protein-S-isoprenylcysteine O-methyltransferase Ste14